MIRLTGSFWRFGNAQATKPVEMIETSLRENAKLIITQHGISPTLLLGSVPVGVSRDGR